MAGGEGGKVLKTLEGERKKKEEKEGGGVSEEWGRDDIRCENKDCIPRQLAS